MDFKQFFLDLARDTWPLPTSPLARRTDPATSKESAMAMRGTDGLGKLQRDALDFLRRYGPATTERLADLYGGKDERILGRRLSELKSAGLVKVVGFKMSRSGRNRQIWAVVR